MAKRGGSGTVDVTSGNSDPKKVDEAVAYWINEIEAAKRREKDFRKDGERIIDIYDGTKADVTPFNILYSNTETLAPALYSAIPRPVVQRRFKDDDPLGLAASKAGERMLVFLLDTNMEGYESFNDAMKAAVTAGILPGRGVTSIKYDFTEGALAPPKVAPVEGEAPPAPQPYKASELVCTDSRDWNRVYFGYARKWSRMPWVAYEEHIDKDEAERLFGPEKAGKLVFTTDEDRDEDDEKAKDDDESNKGERKTCLIYKIWDKKGGKKVRFVAPQDKTQFMRVDDDPLQLTGFFDCPRPLMFVERVSNLTPVALYVLYENQAKELNELTLRITKIARAIKARGAYDSSLGTLLEKIMQEDDNALVPTEQEGVLSAEKGLDKAIWFMPLTELVATLEKLYVAREQCKQVIYEIMGIADIMRGASKASETLGAQEIKNNWGTLRIKPKQAEVQRYARDLLRMMLEVAATKFGEETWAKMTGLPFSTQAQLQQAQALIQAAQLSGQPPDPQALAIVQAPAWQAVLEMLRTDTQRAYRIDIETNSTVEPEAVEDQKNIAELMATLGQFLNGVGGLVEKGVMPFEVAQSMMLAISRRYRFGNEIEEQIKQMKPPPPQDNGEAQKAQEQAQQMQQQVQQATQQAQQAQMAQQATEAKLQASELTNKLQKQEADLQLREHKLETERAVFELEKKSAQESIQIRDQVGQEKIQHREKVANIQDAAAKREQQTASKANNNVDVGAKALAKTSADMQAMLTTMLKIVEQQGQQTQEMVKALVAAVTAPRKRTPERGPDGRIASVLEEVAG